MAAFIRRRRVFCLVIPCSCAIMLCTLLSSYRNPTYQAGDNGKPLEMSKEGDSSGAPVSLLSTTIPRIIHQQWDSHLIPGQFAKYIQSWTKLHWKWDYVFWTPADARNLLRNYYPEGLAQYEAERTTLMKTDIMRFYVIHRVGGVYLDLDMECLRPLSSWIKHKQEQCFITEDAHEHSILLDRKRRPTALMPIAGCRPGHPFYELAMDMLDDYQNLTFAEKHYFTDMVYVKYNNTRHSKPISERITMMEPGMFVSIMDPTQLSLVKHTCQTEKLYEQLNDQQRQVCDELERRGYENAPRTYSYSVHHWEHFILWDQDKKDSETVSIYELVPGAKNATEYMRKLDKDFVT